MALDWSLVVDVTAEFPVHPLLPVQRRDAARRSAARHQVNVFTLSRAVCSPSVSPQASASPHHPKAQGPLSAAP